MRDKLDKTKETFAERFDLPKELLLNLPKIVVIGDREISIEGHKGILLFTDDQIQIDTKSGIVNITGSQLEILYIGESTIHLNGIFEGIEYNKYV